MMKTFKGKNYEEIDTEFNEYEKENRVEVVHLARYCDTNNFHYMTVYLKPKHFTL